MKSLPARPSLESLRKQAKKVARDSAAGDPEAIARVHEHLPRIALPLTQRGAQLAIAREYGFAGWQDLVAEVNKRVGNGLEWAAAQTHRAIHDNDIERLKQLLAEYPALLSWHGDPDRGGLLGFATDAYGDAGTPEREAWFTRAVPAELLIDAGAVVTPSVVDGILRSRAKGLLQLFRRKGLLPQTLKFFAALGDADAVRSALHDRAHDLATVNEAFFYACGFGHFGVASPLLDQSVSLDPEAGKRIDAGVGRIALIEYFIREGTPGPDAGMAVGPWKAYVMQQVLRAAHVGDAATFNYWSRHEPWLLGEELVEFQVRLIEAATLNDRESIIVALLDSNPALLRRQPPPPSNAIELAVTYAKMHLLPLLTRIWPLPDDLPYAAAAGSISRVKELLHPSATQRALDTALAYAVINRHFDVADFLLEHGANINTNWNSHEPASILHHLVFEENYESMQYLIDRGIDLSIKDYRWDATAWGWAMYGKSDQKMAQWLEQAERGRAVRAGSS